MFERFTDRARQVLVLAQEEARLLNHNFIGTEHILLGLIHEGGGVAARALESLGIALEAAREKVAETIGPAGSSPPDSPPFTPRAKKVLELSLREALQLGHDYIGTEHMLLGLVREQDGVAVAVLEGLGPSPEHVRERVTQLLGGGPAARAPQAAGRFSPLAVGPRLVRCSFCGRLPPEAGRLMAGIDAFICEACAQQAQSAFRSLQGGEEQHWVSAVFSTEGRPVPTGPPPPVPTGPPPEDEAEARAAVEAAFAAMYDRSPDGAGIPSVEDGGNLGVVLDGAGQWARANGISGPATVTVDDVSFLNPIVANVWFSLESGGRTIYRHRPGRAVLSSQGWMVSRDTFCGLFKGIGISCPPPP